MNQKDPITPKQLLRDFEAEKSLIGFDLHDGVVQLLVGSKLQLDSVDLDRDVENSKTSAKISSVKLILNDAITQLRKLTEDLSATSIENAQLETELESLVDRFRSHASNDESNNDESNSIGIENWITEWQGLPADLDSLIAGTVLGIVKECLNNVIKHSNATSVFARVWATNEQVEVLVFDNGIGINDVAIGDGSSGRRLGLRGIANRSKIFGGTCNVSSQSCQNSNFQQVLGELEQRHKVLSNSTKTGTAVQVVIPISK